MYYHKFSNWDAGKIWHLTGGFIVGGYLEKILS